MKRHTPCFFLGIRSFMKIKRQFLDCRQAWKKKIDTYASYALYTRLIKNTPNWVKDRRRDTTVADHTSSAMWPREVETKLVPHVGILIPGTLF